MLTVKSNIPRTDPCGTPVEINGKKITNLYYGLALEMVGIYKLARYSELIFKTRTFCSNYLYTYMIESLCDNLGHCH